MGLLGGLFGSKKKEITVNGRTRPIPPHLEAATEEQIVQYFELKDDLGGAIRSMHPLKIVMKAVVLHGRSVGVTAEMCRPEAFLVADLGFDVSATGELERLIERQFNDRLTLGIGVGDIRVGDLTNLLADAMGVLTIDVPDVAADVAPPRDPTADVPTQHVLRCVTCKQSSVYPPDHPQVVCPSCHAALTNLGPLPVADLTIRVGGLGTELEADEAPVCEIDELPKWACSYCGRNVGIRAECERCGCDLARTPPVSLRAQLANVTPEERAIFWTLATHPMTDDAALCLLGRLEPERVVGIGGNAQLASKMQPIARPPGTRSS